MSKEARKTAVCTDRYATALLITDNGGSLSYGAVEEVVTTLISTKYAPKMNSAEQYASGVAVDSYVSKSGGTLDIVVVGLDTEDENRYFGSTVSGDGLISSGKDDVVPDRMVIYSTKRSDGKINLYKFPKAKFTSQGEQTETTDSSGIKYSGTQLKAEYKATIYNGKDMHIRKAVDPSTEEGAKLIKAWFETAMGGITDNTMITPAAAVFDKNTEGENNRNLVFRIENGTLSKVKNGDSELTIDTDYKYNQEMGTVTVLRTYLNSLNVSAEPVVLSFTTEKGAASAEITITDTTAV